jgi:hypothetical protein
VDTESLSNYMNMVWTQRGADLSIMLKKQKNSSGASSRKPWVDPDDAPEITDELRTASGNTPKSARAAGSSEPVARRSIPTRAPLLNLGKHDP